ncbi:MAG: class I SAM-dependent methyltransferase [Candidatus Krumholzibacteriia bacterium]
MPGSVDTGGGLYLEPALYDVVNTPGTAAELTALGRVVRGHRGRGPHRWLEPACGSGRYLRSLRARGHQVAGYDPLEGMLAYARRRLSRWTDGWALAQADFTTPAVALAGLGAFDVAFCPVNSLRHLPDDASVAAHLAQVRGLLAPGGLYVVGLDLLRPDALPDEDVWTGSRGRLRVHEVMQYLPPDDGGRTEQVVVQMMVTRPRGTTHHGWAYGLRTYTDLQWSALVRHAGWRRVATHDSAGRAVAAGTPLAYQLEVLQPDR